MEEVAPMVVLDPSWRVEAHEAAVFAIGGADATFVLPVDSAATATRICCHVEKPTAFDSWTGVDSETRDELLGAGILAHASTIPGSAESHRSSSVHVVGPNADALAERFQIAIDDARLQSAARTPSLEPMHVIVRTGGTLLALCDELPGEIADDPHLFVDLAHSHTICVGPLVVPGETACLTCFSGRVARGWGDPEPPSLPGVMRRYLPAAMALAASEVHAAEAGDGTLAGTSFWFDFATRKSGMEPVYKLPWCPNCGNHGAAEPSHRGQSASVWATAGEPS